MTLRVGPTPLLCRWLSRTAGAPIFAPSLFDRRFAQMRIALDAFAIAMRCAVDPMFAFSHHFARAFAQRSLSKP